MAQLGKYLPQKHQAHSISSIHIKSQAWWNILSVPALESTRVIHGISWHQPTLRSQVQVSQRSWHKKWVDIPVEWHLRLTSGLPIHAHLLMHTHAYIHTKSCFKQPVYTYSGCIRHSVLTVGKQKSFSHPAKEKSYEIKRQTTLTHKAVHTQ